MAVSRKKIKGTRKPDRNRKSAQNLRYINERRHAKSHYRRILKHLHRVKGESLIHTADRVAHEALAAYKAAAGY